MLQLILQGRIFVSADETYDYFYADSLDIDVRFMVAENDLEALLSFVNAEGPFQTVCYFNGRQYFMEQLFLEGFHIEKSVEGTKVKLCGRALSITSFTGKVMSHD